MTARPSARTRRGGRLHVVFTVAVFVLLASLDNTAIALVPAMIKPVAIGLGVDESAVGLVTGAVILLTAITAVGWGYLGDRSSRKRLLFWGTLLWAAGTWASAQAGSYGAFFVWQALTAVGLGAIASVGFSVISDFVPPHRRGLAMSFWGLSQGAGGTVGGLVASQLGAGDFRRPLEIVAIAGLGCAVLYLATFDPPRGRAEPELAPLFAAGGDYEYRIAPADVARLLRIPTNLWLVLQGFTAQIAYGSLIWVTFLFQAKVEAAGYDVATATKVGGLFAVLFQIGGLTSIAAGAIGDRLQRRTLRGRALLSAIGILGAIPFFLVFFFLPLRGLAVTPGAGTATLALEVLRSLVANPWVAGSFLSALAAITLTSADSPNWFALIAEANLPEHRGTVFGLGNLSNGIGRAIGNALTGVAGKRLESWLTPPWNWAVGLAMFQLFFVPTGWCYWQAAKSAPDDIARVRATLQERARLPAPGSSPSPRSAAGSPTPPSSPVDGSDGEPRTTS